MRQSIASLLFVMIDHLGYGTFNLKSLLSIAALRINLSSGLWFNVYVNRHQRLKFVCRETVVANRETMSYTYSNNKYCKFYFHTEAGQN